MDTSILYEREDRGDNLFLLLLLLFFFFLFLSYNGDILPAIVRDIYVLLETKTHNCVCKRVFLLLLLLSNTGNQACLARAFPTGACRLAGFVGF
jgi:hypothetical protein